MKKVLIWIVVPILLVVVSIVGTLAYLKATDEAKNVMTVGNIGIQIVEYERKSTSASNADATVQGFNNDKLLLPSTASDDFDYTTLDNTTYVDWAQVGKTGYTSPIWDPTKVSNEVDKMVFVKNTGSYDAYVRLYFAFEAGNFVRLDRFKEMVHLNLDATDWTWEWLDKANHIADIGGTKYFIARATCKVPVKAGELSPISLSQIALDSTAKNGDSLAFGEKYDVLVFAQGIQADGFTSDLGYTPATALDEGFGETIPFKNVKEVNFVDLKTALHYLNGEKSNTKITNKVQTITFGLTKDYAAKVEGHEGVLVANLENQADFTAYAYYVPDGSNYDVYILADGWKIYTPNSSSSLFMGMTALTTVNTANMDVSHTTSMMAMFNSCSNLVDIDIGNWDTSNVTTMATMFYGCSSLETLEAGTWNVSSVTNFNSMFKNCGALENIDVKNWNVSNAQSISNMFCSCSKLRVLDLSNWNTTKVTSCTLMFADCTELTTIYVGGGWDLSNVDEGGSTNMFLNCTNLAGGKGTTYNASKVNKEYARIDGGTSNPGYLTEK